MKIILFVIILINITGYKFKSKKKSSSYRMITFSLRNMRLENKPILKLCHSKFIINRRTFKNYISPWWKGC